MEKLVKFVKGLLTNRFGIVLATLNVCFLPSEAIKCISVSCLPLHNFDKIMLLQNLPATILTAVSSGFMGFLFDNPFADLYHPFGLITLLFFVTLQWLFIGWSVKAIARKIQTMKS